MVNRFDTIDDYKGRLWRRMNEELKNIKEGSKGKKIFYILVLEGERK